MFVPASRRSATLRYALYGFAFGALFPLVALPVACHVATGSCSLEGLRYVQAHQPLLWMIESAPLWLGLFAAFIGRRQDLLAALLDEMEEIIDERTAALRRTADEAQEANDTKSRFLANMSHEIRTPMTAILGYAEELMDPHLPVAERDEAARIIHGNGEHLLTILNDILDLSKIEIGRMEFERVPCSPREIMSDVATLMKERAARKGIGFVVSCDGPVPREIHTDPTRLRQILINLVGNAVKFTEEGCVRVVGRLRNGHAEPQLEIEVADTGVGMSQDELAHIFGAFLQGDQSTTRRFGGTGLGLSITRRLIELMGGDIEVASEPGQGSVFTFRLPTGQLEETAIEPCSGLEVEHRFDAGPAPRLEVDPSLVGRRVLLAEDNEVNRALVERMLGRCGLDVAAVADGQEALDQVSAAETRGEPFDLILMDVQMPVMDGLTATRTLRARGYQAPVLAFTASAMASERERCYEAGCDDFVSKPIRRKQLIDQLSRVLAGAPVRAS